MDNSDLNLRIMLDEQARTGAVRGIDQVNQKVNELTRAAPAAAAGIDKTTQALNLASRAAQVAGMASMGTAEGFRSAGTAALMLFGSLGKLSIIGNILFLVGQLASLVTVLARRFGDAAQSAEELSAATKKADEAFKKLNEASLDQLQGRFDAIVASIDAAQAKADKLFGHEQKIKGEVSKQTIEGIKQRFPPGQQRDEAMAAAQYEADQAAFGATGSKLAQDEARARAKVSAKTKEYTSLQDAQSGASGQYTALVQKLLDEGAITKEEAEKGDFSGASKRATSQVQRAEPILVEGAVPTDSRTPEERAAAMARETQVGSLPGLKRSAEADAETRKRAAETAKEITAAQAELDDILRKQKEAAAQQATSRAQYGTTIQDFGSKTAAGRTPSPDTSVQDEIASLIAQKQSLEYQLATARSNAAAEQGDVNVMAKPQGMGRWSEKSNEGRRRARNISSYQAEQAEATAAAEAASGLEASLLPTLKNITARLQTLEKQLKNVDQ